MNDLEAFKATRLRALANDPLAFGSTLAREAQFGAAEWQRRVLRMDGVSGVGFLARVANEAVACGIVGCFIDQDDRHLAEIVSMWVAEEQRGKGAADGLVDACVDWAATRDVKRIRLMVTSINTRARAFYLRRGFMPTGYREPYPNDASLEEEEMIFDLPGD